MALSGFNRAYRMRPSLEGSSVRWKIGGTLIIVLVVVYIGTLVRGAGERPASGAPGSPATAPRAPVITQQPQSADQSAMPALPTDRAATPPDHPAIKNYTAYIGFQERTRAYFDGAAKLSAEERKRRAAALAQEIAAQEKAGKLLPVESLFLNLAILKHTSANDEAYKPVAEQMIAEFRARADHAESERVAQALVEPRFVAYKEREAAIVQEAMAIPAGPGRDDFLRQRLEEARIEAYRGTAKR